MKRTKNMKYNKTWESSELQIFIDNDDITYNYHLTPVIKSLARKVKKGVYDSEKGIDAFYHVACYAAKRYNEEFKLNYYFSVTDRFTAATELEARYRDEIFEEAGE